MNDKPLETTQKIYDKSIPLIYKRLLQINKKKNKHPIR